TPGLGDRAVNLPGGPGQPLEFRGFADRVQVPVAGEQLVPEALPKGARQECERLWAVVRVLPGGQGVNARDLVKRGRSVVAAKGGFGVLVRLRVLTQAGQQDAAPAPGLNLVRVKGDLLVEYAQGVLGPPFP